MPAERTTAATAPPATRSQISNGSRLFLPGVSGRSAEARRYRDIYRSLIARLEAVGPVSDLARDVVFDMASLRLEIDRWRTRQAAGEPINLAELTIAVNAYQRSAMRLGLDLRVRPSHEPSKLDRMIDEAQR